MKSDEKWYSIVAVRKMTKTIRKMFISLLKWQSIPIDKLTNKQKSKYIITFICPHASDLTENGMEEMWEKFDPSKDYAEMCLFHVNGKY